MKIMASIIVLLVSIIGTPAAQGEEPTYIAINATKDFNGWRIWKQLDSMSWEDFSQDWDKLNPGIRMDRVGTGQEIKVPYRPHRRDTTMPPLTILDRVITTQTTPATTPVINITTTVVIRPNIIKIDIAPLATVIGRSVDNIARASIFVGQAIAAKQRQEVDQAITVARQKQAKLEQELAAQTEKAASYEALVRSRDEQLSAALAQAAQLGNHEVVSASAPEAVPIVETTEHVSRSEMHLAMMITEVSALVAMLMFFFYHRVVVKKMKRELDITYSQRDLRDREGKALAREMERQNEKLRGFVATTEGLQEELRIKQGELLSAQALAEHRGKVIVELETKVSDLTGSAEQLSVQLSERSEELAKVRQENESDESARVLDVVPPSQTFQFELREQFTATSGEHVLEFAWADKSKGLVAVMRKTATGVEMSQISTRKLLGFLKGDGNMSAEAREFYGLTINIHGQTTASDCR